MNDQQIQALLRPQAYPHGVDDLRLIETHISWVVLTGEFAYKLKKPLALDFLDFTRLEQRRHFCEEELRLNRRFAPDLYLDVVAVAMVAGQPTIGGAGEVVDYAVRMRQFSQTQLASHVAAQGHLTHDQCRDIGRTIAVFHNSLTGIRPSASGPPNQAGTPQAVLLALKQNFRQIEQWLPADENRRALHAVRSEALLDYSQREERLQERIDSDFVRDCHGDLHLGNIALLDDRVQPFDCIEFNPAFRLIDIQCEIAFLTMDLESRGLTALANTALNSWLEHTGDYGGLDLHGFYERYLAMVRAKISLISALEQDAARPDLADLADFHRYLTLAATLRQPAGRYVCIMMGVSGSGKSTVAAALAAHFAAVRIRSDVERKRLFGLTPSEDSQATAFADEFYSEHTSDRVFARLRDLAQSILEAGLPVIVDAVCITHARREPFLELAYGLGVECVIVHCQAPEEELVRRLQARSARRDDVSEAGVAVMRDQQRHLELPIDTEATRYVPVDTTQPDYLQHLIGTLERRFAE